MYDERNGHYALPDYVRKSVMDSDIRQFGTNSFVSWVPGLFQVEPAQIKPIQHSGTSYYVHCPYCDHFIILGGTEFRSMSAICNKCHKSFKLRKYYKDR